MAYLIVDKTDRLEPRIVGRYPSRERAVAAMGRIDGRGRDLRIAPADKAGWF